MAFIVPSRFGDLQALLDALRDFFPSFLFQLPASIE